MKERISLFLISILVSASASASAARRSTDSPENCKSRTYLIQLNENGASSKEEILAVLRIISKAPGLVIRQIMTASRDDVSLEIRDTNADSEVPLAGGELVSEINSLGAGVRATCEPVSPPPGAVSGNN